MNTSDRLLSTTHNFPQKTLLFLELFLKNEVHFLDENTIQIFLQKSLVMNHLNLADEDELDDFLDAFCEELLQANMKEGSVTRPLVSSVQYDNSPADTIIFTIEKNQFLAFKNSLSTIKLENQSDDA